MRIPDFAKLREERAHCRKVGGRCCCTHYSSGIHPNPRFYKYYWWVFWNESPVDGDAFLGDQYRLSTAAAMQLLKSLEERNEPCWLYNTSSPRLGSTIPFDPQSKHWQGVKWAPAYDDDPDPVVEIQGSGHK